MSYYQQLQLKTEVWDNVACVGRRLRSFRLRSSIVPCTVFSISSCRQLVEIFSPGRMSLLFHYNANLIYVHLDSNVTHHFNIFRTTDI